MGHLYVLLGEGPIWVLCPFLNWIICLPGFESYKYLYNLEVKLLSDVLLANMFYHIVGSLFILMMVSLVVQKHFKPSPLLIPLYKWEDRDSETWSHLREVTRWTGSRARVYTLAVWLQGTCSHCAALASKNHSLSTNVCCNCILRIHGQCISLNVLCKWFIIARNDTIIIFIN